MIFHDLRMFGFSIRTNISEVQGLQTLIDKKRFKFVNVILL